MNRNYTIPLVTLFIAIIFWECNKKWDDHNNITDNQIKENLLTAIKNTAGLAKFNELLIKSGYDKIISASKTFTVWAPTDQALQTLDPAIVNDTLKLKLFIGNHIANQSYTVGGTDQRIKMMNGKYITVTSNKFDSASITTANKYANNGIFHVIDKFVPRLDNCWEFINNTTAAPLMKSFLLSLNYLKFDPALAVQTGVDAATGLPIYKPGTGNIARNGYLDSVMNISDETNHYTVILLNDVAYTREFNKLTPWFKTSTSDSTNRLAASWLVKDLAFSSSYTADRLPDTLPSQYGVKVPLNKPAVTASYRTSNGMVYVMNQVDFNLAYKFPPIILEGENPASFNADRSANTFYRVKKNPNTNIVYRDILVQNYGFANFAIKYTVNNMSNMRYDAYWVAINDIVPPPAPPALPAPWSQRLAIDSILPVTFPYVPVQYNNYSEVKLGTFTINNFRNVNLFVVGPAASSTINNVDVISLDYIKLVPAF